MIIRESNESDLTTIMEVNKAAFNSDIEPKLVSDLLSDPTAKPLLSLVAIINDIVVGHILFTKCSLDSNKDISIYILAPVSVLPSHQGTGIGGALISRGLEILETRGVDLVFVLGHPSYYPRFGFKPAVSYGFDATYPIAEENSDAWMVHILNPRVVGDIRGKVVCADMLNKPEYW
jgi:putative acetyltransferase